ncbi:MAG: hypothetical protein V2A58_00420, partial [Planctomycetota bacterium]
MCLFDKRRKRRVIYNDDSDQQYSGYDGYSYKVTDERSFLEARTTPTFDTQVDTYAWCVGNGADPPWGTWGEKNRARARCLRSADHAADVIIEACHAKGMEVWGSLRMNDIHDAFMAKTLEETHDPLKAEHPEYLIGKVEDRDLPAELTERYLWTAFNFERPEVRKYRLEFIERNAGMHDFDGYELDFTRFVCNFEMGREAELAPMMTEFMRECRRRLTAIGKKRGRPYLLVAHVMDSVETSLLLGQDVEAWLREGLVDILVVGMGYLPFALAMDEWRALGAKHGVPVYPSLNTNTLNPIYKERMKRVSAWHEAIRGAAAWWWQCGGDGLYLFNLFCQEDKTVGPDGSMKKGLVYAPLSEAGDPETLAGKTKLYGIHPSSRGGFCHHGSEASCLPVPLEKMERKLPLMMGPDAKDGRASFKVYAWTTGGVPDAKVYMRLNHKLL